MGALITQSLPDAVDHNFEYHALDLIGAVPGIPNVKLEIEVARLGKVAEKYFLGLSTQFLPNVYLLKPSTISIPNETEQMSAPTRASQVLLPYEVLRKRSPHSDPGHDVAEHVLPAITQQRFFDAAEAIDALPLIHEKNCSLAMPSAKHMEQTANQGHAVYPTILKLLNPLREDLDNSNLHPSHFTHAPRSISDEESSQLSEFQYEFRGSKPRLSSSLQAWLDENPRNEPWSPLRVPHTELQEYLDKKVEVLLYELKLCDEGGPAAQDEGSSTIVPSPAAPRLLATVLQTREDTSERCYVGGSSSSSFDDLENEKYFYRLRCFINKGSIVYPEISVLSLLDTASVWCCISKKISDKLDCAVKPYERGFEIANNADGTPVHSLGTTWIEVFWKQGWEVSKGRMRVHVVPGLGVPLLISARVIFQYRLLEAAVNSADPDLALPVRMVAPIFFLRRSREQKEEDDHMMQVEAEKLQEEECIEAEKRSASLDLLSMSPNVAGTSSSRPSSPKTGLTVHSPATQPPSPSPQALPATAYFTSPPVPNLPTPGHYMMVSTTPGNGLVIGAGANLTVPKPAHLGSDPALTAVKGPQNSGGNAASQPSSGSGKTAGLIGCTLAPQLPPAKFAQASAVRQSAWTTFSGKLGLGPQAGTSSAPPPPMIPLDSLVSGAGTKVNAAGKSAGNSAGKSVGSATAVGPCTKS